MSDDPVALYERLVAQAGPKNRGGRPRRLVKRVAIMLRLEPDLAAKVDALAARWGVSRHGVIVALLTTAAGDAEANAKLAGEITSKLKDGAKIPT